MSLMYRVPEGTRGKKEGFYPICNFTSNPLHTDTLPHPHPLYLPLACVAIEETIEWCFSTIKSLDFYI
jgi:hypothetical protein